MVFSITLLILSIVLFISMFFAFFMKDKKFKTKWIVVTLCLSSLSGIVLSFYESYRVLQPMIDMSDVFSEYKQTTKDEINKENFELYLKEKNQNDYKIVEFEYNGNNLYIEAHYLGEELKNNSLTGYFLYVILKDEPFIITFSQ